MPRVAPPRLPGPLPLPVSLTSMSQVHFMRTFALSRPERGAAAPSLGSVAGVASALEDTTGVVGATRTLVSQQAGIVQNSLQ